MGGKTARNYINGQWVEGENTGLLDVENENGEVVPWVIEHSNVSTLARMGYHRNSLKPGQPVTVYINPGRDGVPIGLCRRVVLEDGTEIFVRGETVD